MFDKAIIETDKFLNVSLSAKAIYFLLGMEADDEGFVSPKRVLRLYGGEMGDIKNLIDVGLIIPFESGVVVITDWLQNNWLDSRRIKNTQYQEEKKQLSIAQNKYLLSDGLAVAKREEYSIEEKSIEEKREEPSRRFTPPSLSEVESYCSERKNGIDANNFINFYSAKGWLVGKNKMKDWKAAIRTWESRNKESKSTSDDTEMEKYAKEMAAKYGEERGIFKFKEKYSTDDILKVSYIFGL